MSFDLKIHQEAMNKKLEHLDRELSKMRTGRASASMLDGIKVTFHGSMVPLMQIASVSAPDPKMLMIAPFDKKNLSEISKAIQMSSLGIQPQSDGTVIRLPIPPSTEERRKELAKQAHKVGEDVKVMVRKVRQDAMADLKKLEKEKKISEDDGKRFQKEVQTLTDSTIKKLDEKVSKKGQEILKM